MKLKTRKLGSHWWITGDDEDGPCGPYDTKAEAESDRKGLIRFNRYEDNPEYVTTDKPKGEQNGT